MKGYQRVEELPDGKNSDPILDGTPARLQNKVVSKESTKVLLTQDMRSEFGEDVPPRQHGRNR